MKCQRSMGVSSSFSSISFLFLLLLILPPSPPPQASLWCLRPDVGRQEAPVILSLWARLVTRSGSRQGTVPLPSCLKSVVL